MGCDIHLSVERQNDDGTWSLVPGPKVACYCIRWKAKEGEAVTPPADCEDCHGSGELREDWYHNRNYDLFAILADVRNGRGFAGIPTGEGFNVIVAPRGVPGDASPEYAARVERWRGGGHSHSWVLLSELTAFDWNQTTKLYGVVGPEGYKEFKEKGSPSSYSADVSGGKVRKISNAEMEDLIAGKFIREPGLHYVTLVQWEASYNDAAGKWFLPKIEEARVEANVPPEKLRVVFFFDS